MPSQSKEAFVAELTEELKKSENVLITEYQGMTAVEFDELRALLRPAGGKYQVVKNRLAKIALGQAGFSDLSGFMKGPSALVYHGADGASLTKTLFKFGEQHSNLKVKAGRVLGLTADAKALKTLSNLPSREVLLATLLSRLQGPLTMFVTTLNEPLRSLHAALGSLAKKKETAKA